jgi:hypothetical protein
VAVTVAVPGGVMDIEISGMDGTGLDVDVPTPVSFTWSITAAGVPGPQHAGDLTLTLEPAGTVLVAGDVALPSACQILTLRDASFRVAPDLLPTFLPTGTSEIYGAATNPLYILEGEVTFDGEGRAVVDAAVSTPFGPSAEDFTVSLN